MNRILLCEGKTDAVLLGYYLDKVCGYEHTKKVITKQIKINKSDNEFFAWHKKGNDCLLIWGVGGKNCFKPAIEQFYNVLKKSSDDEAYNQFLLVCDRDLEKDNKVILAEYSECFTGVGIPLTNNKVETGEYINSFEQGKSIKTFALVIPDKNLGALETILIDSLKEDEYDRKIVNQSEKFVVETRQIADKYITSDRLELKAKLSTVFAIMSPDKVFNFIDDILKTTVKWEDKESLNDLFKPLIQSLGYGDGE